MVLGNDGPFIVHNCTQAAARDVIVEAALRVDRHGLGDLILSVHDELIFEVETEKAEILSQEIQARITQRPSWGKDLPVACEGGVRARYGGK